MHRFKIILLVDKFRALSRALALLVPAHRSALNTIRRGGIEDNTLILFKR